MGNFDLRRGLGLILIVIGLGLPVIYFATQAAQPAARSTLAPTGVLAAAQPPTATPTATRIVERLIPTLVTQSPTVAATSTPIRAATVASTRAATRSITNTARPTIIQTATAPTPTSTPTALPPVVINNTRQRFGIGVSLPAPHIARLTELDHE